MQRKPLSVPVSALIATFTLTMAVAPWARAQEGSPDLHQMQEEMRQMQAQVQEAEKRATAAESKVTDLQKQVNGMTLRGQEQAKKDAAAAKASGKPALSEQEYSKANPDGKDVKDFTLAPKYDTPFATLDINYFYMRTGEATSINGGPRENNDGRNTAFVNGLVSDNNAGRLGNELDTYLEPSFKVVTSPFKDPTVTAGGVFTLSSYASQRSQADLPTNFATLDLYAFIKNAVPFLPGAEVWAGRRGYEYQFYMNIIDRRSYVIGGDGGGFNDIALGDFAKLDIAYLTGSPTGGTQSSVNPLNPGASTFGDVRTTNGNLSKQSGYIRLHDITTPVIGGQSAFLFQYQHSNGGTALVSGDFQGVPGPVAYNNLNYAGGIRFQATDGYSGGYVNDYKHDFLSGDLKMTNHLFLGFGFGDAFDTTNTDKLRNSPFYGIPLATLQGLNNVPSTLADAHAYKEADQIDFYYKEKFELEAMVVYEHENTGRPNVPIPDAALPVGGPGTVTVNVGGVPEAAIVAKGKQDWVDVGVRPTYNLTPFFAIVAEGTYQYIDNSAQNAIRSAAGFSSGPGDLFKFTICPTFHYGKTGNYPLTLRFFYTFAAWNDNLKGSIVGGDTFRNNNYGHIFGTQAEINF